MIVRFKSNPFMQNDSDLPIRWLFKDYYRVIDPEKFFLLTIQHGLVYETLDDNVYLTMLFSGLDVKLKNPSLSAD
jgi:hypothetical protein